MRARVSLDPAEASSARERYPRPSRRPLKVYAFDPTMGRLLGNVMQTSVPFEQLEPGPVGERFAVVDYDSSAETYYAPVDLDDPAILIAGGLDPTESDPRFHQQMVYAVASETLERFERALGRRVHWRLYTGSRPKTVNRLYLFPHAMVQANAFYDRRAHGVLFGYFRATDVSIAQALPGQTIFTCLSHDIVAHEVTHAVVDGVREYFMEPTNIDVPAFHEAFADLTALFRHFSHQEVLLDTLQRTGGLLYRPDLAPDAAADQQPIIQAEMVPDNPLISLARQFGQVEGMRSGLRSALGTKPSSDDINKKTEPHARGSILVAAVFDAFFTVYIKKTANVFHTFRAGGGSLNPTELPAPFADILAKTASETADMFFGVCARALDYCPPVDITFGDYLRALLTADRDLFPSDVDGVRDALMQAFRLRGIYPEDAEYFSEDSLCWQEYPDLPPVSGLLFGDPNGLTTDEKNTNGKLLRSYAKTNFAALGFPNDLQISAPSFHPMFRTDEDGSLRIDMVVEMVQEQSVALDPAQLDFGGIDVRGGVTLLIKKPRVHEDARQDPIVRFAIRKHITDERIRRQRAAYGLQNLSGKAPRINFALIHGV